MDVLVKICLQMNLMFNAPMDEDANSFTLYLKSLLVCMQGTVCIKILISKFIYVFYLMLYLLLFSPKNIHQLKWVAL